ncbi:MAG TPA: CPBP family intramembrane metalloprotease, partial [Chromatiaceae bacterium]|nr:CPBP family intramembrane metalloprotease [Chromatiaceae bacterium]
HRYKEACVWLLTEIADGRLSAAIDAVISSLLFALVHTQIFQSDYLAAYGSGPAVYRIFNRLFNIFLIALLLALLRQRTQSILPGALIHSYLQAGIFTLPVCLLIYTAIALWAYARGEVVWLTPGAKDQQ